MTPPPGPVVPRRGVAIGRGGAVVAVWFLAAAALASWGTSWIANLDSGCQDENPWCGLSIFLAAVTFAVWAGLVLLIGLGIALATLVVVTRRIRSGLGAGHVAVGVGLVGGAELATALLVAGVAVLVIRSSW